MKYSEIIFLCFRYGCSWARSVSTSWLVISAKAKQLISQGQPDWPIPILWNSVPWWQPAAAGPQNVETWFRRTSVAKDPGLYKFQPSSWWLPPVAAALIVRQWNSDIELWHFDIQTQQFLISIVYLSMQLVLRKSFSKCSKWHRGTQTTPETPNSLDVKCSVKTRFSAPKNSWRRTSKNLQESCTSTIFGTKYLGKLMSRDQFRYPRLGEVFTGLAERHDRLLNQHQVLELHLKEWICRCQSTLEIQYI